MDKIITHDGIFHADDAMAVALILEFIKDVAVYRTRDITEKDKLDKNVWIVDVGGEYNPLLHNFDHHQDSSLPSACLLVLYYLLGIKKVSTEEYIELEEAIKSISSIDCNGFQNEPHFVFNSLIKSFNYLDVNSWITAVYVCRQYIKSRRSVAKQSAQSEKIWSEGEKIGTNIKVCESFPINWKKYNEEKILVYPFATKWNVITTNPDELPLKSTGKEEFIHSNLFIAAFKNKEEAIECAKKSCEYE